MKNKLKLGEGGGYVNELKYLINAIDIVNHFDTDLDEYCENSNVADSITLLYKVNHLPPKNYVREVFLRNSMKFNVKNFRRAYFLSLYGLNIPCTRVDPSVTHVTTDSKDPGSTLTAGWFPPPPRFF